MAPPIEVGHTNADDESSTKGPEGLALVALEMHIAEVGPLAARTHPAADGVVTQEDGSVAGVA